MKRLLRITLILVLVATTGLVGSLPEAKSDPNTVAETETATTEENPIPVSLPTEATVTLNDGNTRSGQVVDSKLGATYYQKGQQSPHRIHCRYYAGRICSGEFSMRQVPGSLSIRGTILSQKAKYSLASATGWVSVGEKRAGHC